MPENRYRWNKPAYSIVYSSGNHARAASPYRSQARGVNLRKHTDVLGDADDTTSKTSGIHVANHHGQTASLRDIARLSRLRCACTRANL